MFDGSRGFFFPVEVSGMGSATSMPCNHRNFEKFVAYLG